MLFFSIILFHELGHILGGLYYKWNIDKIIILPFGGLTIFNENINKPLKEEFIICILGPVFQIIYYLLIHNIVDIKIIHNNLLLFNLLPIFPLDGSKIFNILLNKLFSFKSSLYLTSFISIIIIVLLIIITKFNLLLMLILIFLFFKNLQELKNINYTFNRFLLERKVNRFYFKKTKIIKNKKINKMKRDYYHLFFIKNKYVTEKELLHKLFDFHRIL